MLLLFNVFFFFRVYNFITLHPAVSRLSLFFGEFEMVAVLEPVNIQVTGSVAAFWLPF